MNKPAFVFAKNATFSPAALKRAERRVLEMPKDYFILLARPELAARRMAEAVAECCKRKKAEVKAAAYFCALAMIKAKANNSRLPIIGGGGFDIQIITPFLDGAVAYCKKINAGIYNDDERVWGVIVWKLRRLWETKTQKIYLTPTPRKEKQ